MLKGAILALSTCSGFDPVIPMRVGRIDAIEAGPTGVPEAFTDVNNTLAQFARAGFNQSEAIMAVYVSPLSTSQEPSLYTIGHVDTRSVAYTKLTTQILLARA